MSAAQNMKTFVRLRKLQAEEKAAYTAYWDAPAPRNADERAQHVERERSLKRITAQREMFARANAFAIHWAEEKAHAFASDMGEARERSRIQAMKDAGYTKLARYEELMAAGPQGRSAAGVYVQAVVGGMSAIEAERAALDAEPARLAAANEASANYSALVAAAGSVEAANELLEGLQD